MYNIDLIEQDIANLSLNLLDILLRDMTTKSYLKWGTDNYKSLGENYYPEKEIKPELIIGNNTTVIQPRISKDIIEQLRRTRDMAEVFTPSWVCNKQNNLIDNIWFGKNNIFNFEIEEGWLPNQKRIEFPEGKNWKDYVNARRMEISCGEAPYLVSRYDTVTGKIIPIEQRIGFLDRKLRIINENIDDDKSEWIYWAQQAYKNVYGYDYQGDNVVLARENLLATFVENMQFKFGETPNAELQEEIAKIIAWNIWQMDGISMTAPYAQKKYKKQTQFSLFGEEITSDIYLPIDCKIYDWEKGKSVKFNSIMRSITQ